jgi:hypothetical protein
MIFSSGVSIFLFPNTEIIAPTLSLALLCLINCLMIGVKEQAIDAALKVRSLAHMASRLLVAVAMTCALSLSFLDLALTLPIGLSLALLCTLHWLRTRLSVEAFRVLADSSLLAGPAAALCINL